MCCFSSTLYLYPSGFILITDEVNFNQWSAFFGNTINKILTSLFFMAFAVHTWLGTWAVASDYLTPRIFGGLGEFYMLFLEVLLLA